MSYHQSFVVMQPQAYSTPARAPSVTSSQGGSSTDGSSGRCGKTKLTQSQRMAANKRERRRMTSLNTAFDVLRNCLPEDRPKDTCSKKTLSKVETLRLAIAYISKLQKELGSDSNASTGLSNPSQLICQLPDQTPQCFSDNPSPTLPSGVITPPAPVYGFGGMVQHSHNGSRSIKPIASDHKFNFQLHQQQDSRLAMLHSSGGYLTPGSTSSSAYPSPQPATFSYNTAFYLQQCQQRPVAWYN